MTLSRTRAAELLHNTADLIDNVKSKEYGDPDESFTNIAAMWSLYLGHHISMNDVAIMMILLKICRNKHLRKEDNYVDICGYAALAGSDDTIR